MLSMLTIFSSIIKVSLVLALPSAPKCWLKNILTQVAGKYFSIMVWMWTMRSIIQSKYRKFHPFGPGNGKPPQLGSLKTGRGHTGRKMLWPTKRIQICSNLLKQSDTDQIREREGRWETNIQVLHIDVLLTFASWAAVECQYLWGNMEIFYLCISFV